MTLHSPQSLFRKVEEAEAATAREREKFNRLSKQVEDMMTQLGVRARVDSMGTIQTPNEPLGWERELARNVKMGRDFEKILNEIKGNQILKSLWDKLVMTMRLTDDRT